jgi:hypothetical protein
MIRMWDDMLICEAEKKTRFYDGLLTDFLGLARVV